MRRPWLVLLALVPIYMTWTFDHGLWNPDETRDAGIAKEMYVSGNFAVPTLNGHAFLEKPPLYYWAAAAAYELSGRITPGTTRLPSALFGLLGILFTFLIARRLYDSRTAAWAAVILATSGQYFRMSHMAQMDVALAALIAGALYFHLRGSIIGFAAATTLAFFAKGFLSVALAGAVVIADELTAGRPKRLFKIIALSAPVFLVITAPWFHALWSHGGWDHLRVFLIDNHWHRFATETGDHTEHFWFYYLFVLPLDMMPWTPALAGAALALRRGYTAILPSREHRFCYIWTAVIILVLTLSSSKRSIYLLPLYPAAAILAARWLTSVAEQGARGADKWLLGFGALMAAAFAACVPVAGLNLGFRSPVVLFSLFAGLAAAAWVVVRVTRHGVAGAGASVPTAIAVAVLCSGAWLPAHMDKDKSFEPLMREIEARRGGRTVIGYQMSEMERGVFGFYLGAPIANPQNTEELTELIKRTGAENALLFTNRNKAPQVAPALGDRLRPVFAFRPQKRTRSYVVYAAGAS